MNTGLMDKRVVLQKKHGEKNSLNQTVFDYVDVRTVWARITPVGGKTDVQSSAISSEVTHEIKIHFRGGVLSGMRFFRCGRNFDIIEPPINEREENRFLVCLCREVIG